MKRVLFEHFAELQIVLCNVTNCQRSKPNIKQGISCYPNWLFWKIKLALILNSTTDSPSFNPATMDRVPHKQMESWAFCFSQGCFWGVFPCKNSIQSYFLRFIVTSHQSGKNHSTAKGCPLSSKHLLLSHPPPLYLQPPLKGSLNT